MVQAKATDKHRAVVVLRGDRKIYLARFIDYPPQIVREAAVGVDVHSYCEQFSGLFGDDTLNIRILSVPQYTIHDVVQRLFAEMTPWDEFDVFVKDLYERCVSMNNVELD